ncbi:uncharacterized protein EAF02_007075 [Botrytis sinoallii]|uniref:uncharacterized protein n=1 Tax=Botrytis sinoallii TaxID=1463999 RepID=UPI001900F6CD|nr:uncharacterized protein EAF02_007075 [Botrytis sinoallii]KAF7881184.1 hypothetical protein EAF02_007075 [Botrytis sinoallii]
MAKTNTTVKKYKTRAAKRRAKCRANNLPLPPPRTVFLAPRAMVWLTAKEKRAYTKTYKCKYSFHVSLARDHGHAKLQSRRHWPTVLKEYAQFPLAHLDRKLYKNYGSIRDKLSVSRDQLDDMEGEQDHRRAAMLARRAANKANRK